MGQECAVCKSKSVPVITPVPAYFSLQVPNGCPICNGHNGTPTKLFIACQECHKDGCNGEIRVDGALDCASLILCPDTLQEKRADCPFQNS